MSRTLALLSLVLATAACEKIDVTSRHPLTAEDAAAADPRLEGLWQVVRDPAARASLPDGPFHLIYLRLPGGPEVEAGFLDVGSSAVGADRLGALSGQVGQRWYLSVHGYANDPGDARSSMAARRRYRLLRCDFEADGSLRLRALVSEVVAEATRRGELAGRATYAGRVHLTAPTEALAAFVERAEPSSLFEPFLVLRRIPLPAPIGSSTGATVAP